MKVCQQCGTKNEDNFNFCYNCAAPLSEAKCADLPTEAADDDSVIVILHGQTINMSKIISLYGKRKIVAIKYIRELSGAGLAEAKEAYETAEKKIKLKTVAPAEQPTDSEEKKPGIWEAARMQARQQQEAKLREKEDLKARIAQMDHEGIAYCPKCYSTSLSSNKKGFGIGKAVVGAAVTFSPIGLVAGNLGAKKVRVTCLKCGHQFWAGQK